MRTGALLFVLGAWTIAQGADISVPGGVLRVEKNSQIRMTDDLVDLTGGTITYQVQDPDAARVAIQTPSVSVRARAEGVYRIAVRQSGESEITAQSGRMVVMAPAGEQWLEAGQKMIARGPRVNPEFRIVSAVAWWRRLASMLQNMQIGGGVGVGGGGEEQTAPAKETHTKPNSVNAAVPSGSAHSSEDRAKTSDGHSNTSGNSAHSGDSRQATRSGSDNSAHSGDSHPATSSGSSNSSHSSASHAAPASSGASSSHSSESHAAPAASNSSSHSDSAAKGK